MRLVGVTMRITQANGYDEPRDSLAQDWARFLRKTDVGMHWVAIPNIGPEAITYADALGVGMLILSGGDDLGEYPSRDRTETTLAKAWMDQGKPILGVCRGMQLLNTLMGGSISKAPNVQSHVATRHKITLREETCDLFRTSRCLEANSFHNNCIGKDDLAADASSLAAADDGSIEMLSAHNNHTLGIMWHPERSGATSALDHAIVRHLLGLAA